MFLLIYSFNLTLKQYKQKVYMFWSATLTSSSCVYYPQPLCAAPVSQGPQTMFVQSPPAHPHIVHLYINGACVYSHVDSGPGPPLRAPQLPLVGSQEEDGRSDEEQHQQQQSLPGSAAQRQLGHAAVPGGRQAGESDPVEEEQNDSHYLAAILFSSILIHAYYILYKQLRETLHCFVYLDN